MMNILSEDLDKNIERQVDAVYPREQEFKECFENRATPPILIDPLHDADMKRIAESLDAGYIDLSTAISYSALSKGIRLYPKAIIFDNSDLIPDSPDKEFICQTVRYALKGEEDAPLADNQYIDFSKVKVGARCREYPGYLEPVYNYVFKIEIPKQ